MSRRLKNSLKRNLSSKCGSTVSIMYVDVRKNEEPHVLLKDDGFSKIFQ